LRLKRNESFQNKVEEDRMLLTDEEKKMLDGKYGEPVQWAMDLLVKVGNYFGAANMVDIKHVNILEQMGTSEKSCLELMDYLVEKGGKFRVITTTDPAGFDFTNIEGMDIEPDTYQKQAKLSNGLIKMGALPTRTCTMYWAGVMPRLGDHLAISESNAVVTFNSVVGARTNYESFPSSLASALTGKAPNFGFHLNENRKGNVLVELKTPMEHLTDWDALGFYVGKELKVYEAVPVFINLPATVTIYELKRLGATLATGPGTIAMYHAVGITPEAATLEQALAGNKPQDKLQVTRKGLNEVYEMFSGEGKIDLVHFGCPHLHLAEIQMLAEKFSGKRKHPEVRVWLFTAPATKAMADLAGYTRTLEDAGCEFFTGACNINIPAKEAKKLLGDKVQLSDHVKHCYYAPTFMGDIGLKTILKPTEECVQAALSGRV
jgi:predicted aconitase